MRERLTFLVYDEGGTFVRLKLFSKKLIRLFCVFGILLIVFLGFLFVDYAFLKYANYQSRDLRDELRILRADLKDRNEQIEAFYTKIDALQLKLIKLNQLEQEIRSYTGLKNSANDTGDYGVGGIFSEESGTDVCTAEFYNRFLENMEQDVNLLDRRLSDQSEEFHMLWETLKEIKAIQQVTPSMRPIDGGWISSKFGFRKSPFSDKQEFHAGVDIAAHKGTPVMATANGTVIFSGHRGTYGKVVYIDHGFGIMTRYAHLDRCHAKKGQKVSRGEMIGEVGSTGKSTGPHLHYEVRLNDIPVNAEKYMSEYLAQKDPS